METVVSRNFRRTGLRVVLCYFVVFLATFYGNYKLHPSGPMLWFLASLPVLPLLGVIVLMGRYLRDERDEYKRDLVVRTLLWGTAGSMAVTLFSGYLRLFGWTGQFPPLTELFVFVAFALIAKFSYRAANRSTEE